MRWLALLLVGIVGCGQAEAQSLAEARDRMAAALQVGTIRIEVVPDPEPEAQPAPTEIPESAPEPDAIEAPAARTTFVRMRSPAWCAACSGWKQREIPWLEARGWKCGDTPDCHLQITSEESRAARAYPCFEFVRSGRVAFTFYGPISRVQFFDAVTRYLAPPAEAEAPPPPIGAVAPRPDSALAAAVCMIRCTLPDGRWTQGSGVAVGASTVWTVTHVVPDGSLTVLADGEWREARIVERPAHEGLSILNLARPMRSWVEIAGVPPARNDPCTVIGFPAGRQRTYLGTVASLGAKFSEAQSRLIGLTTRVEGGASGGGVFIRGKLVGLVSVGARVDGAPPIGGAWAYAVPVPLARKTGE